MNSFRIRVIPASIPQTGHVWLLTAVGLSTVAIVLAASFWSLIRIRADRVAGDALRAEVAEIATRGDQIVDRFNHETLCLLNNESEDQPNQPERLDLPELSLVVDQSKLTDHRIANTVQDVVSLVAEMQVLHQQCQSLAKRSQRANQARTANIKHSENAIHRLHTILQTTIGTRMLKVVKAFRDYQKLEGSAAQVAAQQFMEDWSPQAIHAVEMREIEDLKLLHLQLVTETNRDAMTDLRDNQIKLRFDRLRRTLQANSPGTTAVANIDSQNLDPLSNNSLRSSATAIEALAELENSFLGDRSPNSDTRKSDFAADAGLYQNCLQWLTLQAERESLKAKLTDYVDKYALVKDRLLSRSSKVTSDSTKHATELVTNASVSIFVIGLVSMIFFVILATKVANTISSQFRTLSQQSIELAAAKALADKLSLVAKHTANSVVITDADSKIEWVNEGFTRLTGYQPEEAIGKVPGHFLQGPNTDPKTIDQIWKAIQERKGCDVEVINYRKNGEPYWVEIEVRPILDSEGNVVNFIRIESDTTQRKDNEREREILAGELQTAARQAGMAELASDVLHNVGNALNSINVSVQTLRDRIALPTSEHLSKASQMIQEHQQNLANFLTSDRRGKQLPNFIRELASTAVSDRQTQLDEVGELMEKIDHVKEIVASQKTFSQRRSPREPISPFSIVQEAIKMNISTLDRHGVRVEEDYEDGPNVLLEKHAILQVLINLIKNAKESIVAADPIDNVIYVSVKRQENQVQFSIRDNGTGIASEKLIEIFRFGFTTKATGQGFGLHSSANVAQELGGTLSVKSDGEGKGATFYLTIPAMDIAPCHA